MEPRWNAPAIPPTSDRYSSRNDDTPMVDLNLIPDELRPFIEENTRGLQP
jgi:hypothetical protein